MLINHFNRLEKCSIGKLEVWDYNVAAVHNLLGMSPYHVALSEEKNIRGKTKAAENPGNGLDLLSEIVVHRVALVGAPRAIS